jgi:arsenate reductase
MKKSITLYGITNCDTVKKARAWLAEQAVEVTFHDFKKQGVPEQRLDAWMAAVGWTKLVNRQGTTWRKLDAATQAAVMDEQSAKTLMLAQPSIIKRPVVEWSPKEVTVGFDTTDWTRRL